MKRLITLVWMALLLAAAPGVWAQARCDACDKPIVSLDRPVSLAGTWLFTRDDSPQNAQLGLDTSEWKVVKAPGPWKKVYDDKKNFRVGWYRGNLIFDPSLVGQEVVLLVNTYVGFMQIYANGEMVYARPKDNNVQRFYSTQAVPVRFKITQPAMTLAMRIDTPLMTGVYQLPFELRRYDAQDAALVGWAVWGGEARSTVGWVAFFFGLFFLLIYSKVRYPLYLVAALGSLCGAQVMVTMADYFAALVSAQALNSLAYVGLSGVFFFFLFSQFFYRFTPRLNWVLGIPLWTFALVLGSMAFWENLNVFQTLRSVYFLTMLVICFVAVYFYIRGVMLKKAGAGTMLVGMSLFTVCSLHDILLSLGVIQSVSLAATALTFCLAAMLLVASRSFANTFVENKRLVRDLTDINENLESLVATRTAALREKTNDIQAMLQNMPQGVLTVMAGGKVHHEYSAYLEQIFEARNLAGQDATMLLFGKSSLGSDGRSQIDAAIASVIGEDHMNYDFNSHLLATETDLTLADGRVKSLEMSWSPICNEQDQVDRVMVCVRDVTELKRLAAEAAGQKRELELIGEILRVSQEKFVSFVDSAKSFIVENRQVIEAQTGRDAEAVNLLFRNMHTIKGNARTYALLKLTNAVHEAEMAYDVLRKDADAVWDATALLEQLDGVEALVDEYAKVNDYTLGRKGPGRRGQIEKFLMVDKEQLNTTLGSLESADRSDLASLGAVVDQVQRTLRRLGAEPLPEVLSGVVESLPSLARELGKEPPQVVIDDQGLLVKSQLSSLIRNLFTHLLRNAVDHGLETADERQAVGKPAIGRIDLKASVEEGRFVLALSDDGRGLALAKIRQRALERSLIDDKQALTDQQVADLIFLPGFSTAEVVTEVSGRGVGMDAVRDFLSRESGDIQLRFSSVTDAGAQYRAVEFLIRLPAAAVVSV
jgi:HPt (histidine-containing phosphotransfer) domain-containing protein/PAS domain-containing protein